MIQEMNWAELRNPWIGLNTSGCTEMHADAKNAHTHTSQRVEQREHCGLCVVARLHFRTLNVCLLYEGTRGEKRNSCWCLFELWQTPTSVGAHFTPNPSCSCTPSHTHTHTHTAAIEGVVSVGWVCEALALITCSSESPSLTLWPSPRLELPSACSLSFLASRSRTACGHTRCHHDADIAVVPAAAQPHRSSGHRGPPHGRRHG